MSETVKAITLVNLFRSHRLEERVLPWACLTLRSALEDKAFAVEIRDLQFVPRDEFEDPEALARSLDDTQPVVGLSLMVDALPLAVELCRHLKLRRPERVLVLGGPGITAVSLALVESFPWIDVVVRGEGEVTLPELLLALGQGEVSKVRGVDARVAGEVIHTPDRPLIEDLDAFSPPRLDDLDLGSHSYMTMVTSRGCPHQCRFCDIQSWHDRRVRSRGVDRVVEELILWHERYGIEYVAFQDDCFLLSRNRVRAILDGIESHGVRLRWACFARVDQVDPAWLSELRARGLEQVYFGVEAGTQVLLDRIGKGVKLGRVIEAIAAATRLMRVTCSFLWGFPDETLLDLLGTIQLIHLVQYHGADIQMGQVVPLAGSALVRERSRAIEYHPEYPFCRLIEPPQRAELARLVIDHPDIFPSFYSFETPDRDIKWELIRKLW